MSLNKIVIPFIAAAGVSVGLLAAPTAAAIDPCRSAVSSSRCLGPQGIDGFSPTASGNQTIAGNGVQNGPYGPLGNRPPIWD